MNTMTYQGFRARVAYDEDDELFVGQIAGINDVISFHSTSVPELKAAFHEAVDDYIAACQTIGKEPEKAYSGKLMLRIDPDIHAQAALSAELAGTSLNQWAEDVLRRAGSERMRSVIEDA